MEEPNRRTPRKRGPATRAVHGPDSKPEGAPLGSPVSLPLIQSSTFSFESPEDMIDVFEGRRAGYVYSRYENPTVRAVESKLAALEGAPLGLLFSSGLAAVHAVLWASLKGGDLLLAARNLYGGTADIFSRVLPRLGVRLIEAELEDEGELGRALEQKPAMVYFETPTNPLVRVLDGSGIVGRAHSVGAQVVVDNTFGTPILQNPLEWGVDLVVHSATKYLGGHSDLVLGVVVGGEPHLDAIEKTRRSLGGVPDPFAAWLLNRGLMTLVLRVIKQSESAHSVARWLADRPDIKQVHYPGLPDSPAHAIAARQMRRFGGILAIELPGGRENVLSFMRGLRLFKLATSLGGAESLVSHPATSSHRMLPAARREALGISEGLVRISIGLEDVEDLTDDLEQALERSGD